MTADKPSSTPAISPLAAIALKLVGVISILSFLVDLANLLLPPDFLNPVWLARAINEIVERGIIPFLGITLLLVGYWVDRTSGRGKQPGSLLIDLRFWSCLLASILGILFIAIPIVNITNNQPLGRVLVERAEQEINRDRALEEQALAGRFNQGRGLLQQLFQNEELLQQFIDSGQLEAAINSGSLP
ncbi:MAG: HpsJ family protein, partial [Cyanobacteria bacterium J06559_3]